VLPLKFSSLRLIVLASLLGLLSACNNQAVEGFLAPDPKLQQNSQAADRSGTQPNDSVSSTSEAQSQLPADFPKEIPLYPQSQLLNIESSTENQQVKTNWSSADNAETIASFYQKQLESDNWQIIQPFSQTTNSNEQILIANRDRLRIAISILPAPTASNNETTGTQFAIAYQANPDAANNSNTPQQPETQSTNQQPNPTTPIPRSPTQSGSQPQGSNNYLQDVIALGVTPGDRISPEQTINRREFARWLVTANNRIYANDPGKQVRMTNKNAQPAFKDITNNDPDFPAIQGLAEAGLIPSSLSGDNSALLFRPDAPLTRETLLAWKVPLDSRKALPKGSIDSVKETWGFQDSNKIDPKALSALYADYQNAEQSNIRRVFGYTTLFQPKKTVTHAEAAAALWFFGDRTDGISASEALQINNQGNGEQQLK
jgi:hypothetical protein